MSRMLMVINKDKKAWLKFVMEFSKFMMEFSELIKIK